MIEERKYCTEIMKKIFNKELVITKKDNEEFKSSTRCCIYDNMTIYNNVIYDILSADVFEKLRNNSLKNYGLCLSHYLSALSLSWDAMLSMAKVELERIPNADVYLFFEKGMRGRVPYISKIYSKANNTCLKSYDPKQGSKYIINIDANNLYG